MPPELNNLTGPEKDLASKAETGEECDLHGPLDPSQRKGYTKEHNIVRAEVIRRLLLGLPLPDETKPRQIHSKGVRLSRAKVVGLLDLEFAEVAVPLQLFCCRLDGGIDLTRARTRSVFLSGSWTPHLLGGGAHVDGDLYLQKYQGRGFQCDGGVGFVGAMIEGDFACSGGLFLNNRGRALNANKATIKGAVFLNDGFEARGEVNLTGIMIDRFLDCSGGKFLNKEGTALSINGATVKGAVFLNAGFEAHGTVDFIAANIGNDLACDKGEFTAPGKVAFQCSNAVIGGNVQLIFNFRASGEVHFRAVHISGQFSFVGGQLKAQGGTAINLDGAHVEGDIHIRQLSDRDDYALEHAKLQRDKIQETVIVGALNLSGAHCRRYWDDEKTWPGEEELILDGFVYDRLGGEALAAPARRRWLRLQPFPHLRREFRPQPWEQLIRVLRAMGHEADARRIARWKQVEIRKSDTLSPLGRVWNLFLGFAIGHGYQPWRAAVICVVVILAGWLAYDDAWRTCPNDPAGPACLMEPAVPAVYARLDLSKVPLPSQYPEFSPFIYSLDVFVPVFDLHQEVYWQPKSEARRLNVVRWLQIALGWVFVSLLIVGMTGLIRKD